METWSSKILNLHQNTFWYFIANYREMKLLECFVFQIFMKKWTRFLKLLTACSCITRIVWGGLEIIKKEWKYEKKWSYGRKPYQFKYFSYKGGKNALNSFTPSPRGYTPDHIGHFCLSCTGYLILQIIFFIYCVTTLLKTSHFISTLVVMQSNFKVKFSI